jgi:hypothetical protein
MMRTVTKAMIALSAAAWLAGCGPQAAEKAGEKADSAISKATDGKHDQNGALATAGQKVDAATAQASVEAKKVGAEASTEAKKLAGAASTEAQKASAAIKAEADKAGTTKPAPDAAKTP